MTIHMCETFTEMNRGGYALFDPSPLIFQVQEGLLIPGPRFQENSKYFPQDIGASQNR